MRLTAAVETRKIVRNTIGVFKIFKRFDDFGSEIFLRRFQPNFRTFTEIMKTDSEKVS